ncbi:DNA polymerase IV [[Eubacterium] cellulosolvens]
MHIDFDYFFAQIEERKSHQLQGKAIVVGVYSGRTKDSGVVSTANYLARQYGVRSGMPIMLAQKRLQGHNSVFLPTDHALYQAVSNKVMTIIQRYGNAFEQTSIDEAFIEVTARVENDIEKAINLAKIIKTEIMEKEKLTCSIGIAPNKLIAKIASNYKKPDGITAISEETVKDFISKLSVRKIPGVGRKTELRLKDMGITTIGELASINNEQLVAVFGKKIGGYLYQASRGCDDRPVIDHREPKQISRIRTLPEDTLDQEKITMTIEDISQKIKKQLSEKRYAFQSIGLIVILDDLSIHSKSLTLEKPTSRTEDIFTYSTRLLDELIQNLPREIRRIGVRISKIIKVEKQKSIENYI